VISLRVTSALTILRSAGNLVQRVAPFQDIFLQPPRFLEILGLNSSTFSEPQSRDHWVEPYPGPLHCIFGYKGKNHEAFENHQPSSICFWFCRPCQTRRIVSLSTALDYDIDDGLSIANYGFSLAPKACFLGNAEGTSTWCGEKKRNCCRVCRE
jgi:hypothetical protein